MESMEEENIYGNQEDMELMRPKQQIFVVPMSKNMLRACISCHLLKTQQQWKRDERCENCGDHKDNRQYTSGKYENILTLLDPANSWLRRRIRLPKGKKLVAGAYALLVY